MMIVLFNQNELPLNPDSLKQGSLGGFIDLPTNSLDVGVEISIEPTDWDALALATTVRVKTISKLEQIATEVLPGVLGIPRAYPPDLDPAVVYLAGLSEGSRRSQRRALRSIASWLSGGVCDEHSLNWPSVGPQHAIALVSTLQKLYEPATAVRMYSAFCAVLKACWRCRLISLEDYSFVSGVGSPKGERVPRGRALEIDEVKTLFEMAEGDCPIRTARDRALLALMYGAGLRRSEAVALDTTDIDLKNSQLLVKRSKGNKSRTVYLDEYMTSMVESWLALRGKGAGPLLCEVRAGKIHSDQGGIPKGISPQALVAILKRLAQTGSVANFASHDLRRTYIGELLAEGTDLATVQSLAGHSNPATTVRYDRRGEERKQEATNKRGRRLQAVAKQL
jgi:integrase/recombinase XerD